MSMCIYHGNCADGFGAAWVVRKALGEIDFHPGKYKQGRDSLVQRGLAAKVVVKGEDGWQAATYAGRDAYTAMFPRPDGPADTINEAKANRTTRRAINSASRAT